MTSSDYTDLQAILATLPAEHAAGLARIVAATAADARFLAVLGGGSLIHGGFDACSDLDLILVAAALHYPAVMAERHAFARRMGGLLSAFTGEHVGEPRLLICLYGPPLLHVDLKFVVPDDLTALVERPRILWARDGARAAQQVAAARVAWPDRPAQWFEDRAWIWLHYCATKWLRGECFEAIGMLAFFRRTYSGPCGACARACRSAACAASSRTPRRARRWRQPWPATTRPTSGARSDARLRCTWSSGGPIRRRRPPPTCRAPCWT